MRERLAALGGHLRLASAPGEGTAVELDVPLAAGGAPDDGVPRGGDAEGAPTPAPGGDA